MAVWRGCSVLFRDSSRLEQCLPACLPAARLPACLPACLAPAAAGKLRRLRQFVRDYRPAEAPPSLAWISVSSGLRGSQLVEEGQQGPGSQQAAAGPGQQASASAAAAAWEAERAQSYEARPRLQRCLHASLHRKLGYAKCLP